MNTTSPNYQVGHEDTFWVADQEKKIYFQIKATIRYVTPHAYMYVENGREVSLENLKQAAETFENLIYPTMRRYFGSEWTPGIDNDPHITILNARIPGVGGYFSTANEYPKAINPYSNEREMLYMNIESAPPGSPLYNATLAHEFQHVIHWNVHPGQETWINEGMSELAMRLAGFAVGLPAAAFRSQPDTQLNDWADDPSRALPHYGAAYYFLSYFARHYGGYERLNELIAEKGRGIQLFQNYLERHGYKTNFAEAFADWVIANYLDDPRLANGRYGYDDLSIRVAAERQPYPVTGRGAVHQYATDYIELNDVRADLSIVFTGTREVNLVDNAPHSGRFEWWSNRGDVIDTTLTRAFDLTGLGRATLQFWLWYDIEKDFDYAYVEVSTDGGRVWQTLPGRWTTDTNPNGSNFGHGYTGKSGGGDKPQWVKEEIDLTSYVGHKVLLRFEYVTDDAYSGPGLCLDDFSIPELGYFDGAETDDSWQAAGFLRSGNIIPQSWLVQVIDLGREPKVERLSLDEEQRGWLILRNPSGEAKRVVLVIAATAPATTEVAHYEYAVTAAP